jgi:hypothetical protein
VLEGATTNLTKAAKEMGLTIKMQRTKDMEVTNDNA